MAGLDEIAGKLRFAAGREWKGDNVGFDVV
jgi:hypothetical protein